MSPSPGGRLSLAPGLARPRATRAFSIALRATWSAAAAAGPILGWAALAILLGALVGLSAIMLPPAAAFAIPGIAGLALLWALPELRAVPARSVRVLFYVVLVVDLCAPAYYAIAGTGLPWISARRVVAFPLILCIALVIGGSPAASDKIVQRLAAARSISICLIGFLGMLSLSIFTSSIPPESVSYLTNAVLTWYVPLVAIIYLINKQKDIDIFIKIIAWCTVFISICGLIQFIVQHNFFLDLLPAPILDALMENNPTFQTMATVDQFRYGEYRAPSVFENSLSFGQFEAMIVPFGYYLLVHRPRAGDRLLGLLVVASAFLGVATSGARGAYISILVATPAFVALWSIRRTRFERRSLAPALISTTGAMSLAAVMVLIFTWTKLYRRVIGGTYLEDASANGRVEQWNAALPHILDNPLTGHGAGNGAEIVGVFNPGYTFPTLDSMLISMLVETGVPGFVFFFGSVLCAIVLGARKYVLDPSDRGAFAGGLSCSLIAFLVYAVVLSQIENFTLLFLFLGLTVAVLSLDPKPDDLNGADKRSLGGAR